MEVSHLWQHDRSTDHDESGCASTWGHRTDDFDRDETCCAAQSVQAGTQVQLGHKPTLIHQWLSQIRVSFRPKEVPS